MLYTGRLKMFSDRESLKADNRANQSNEAFTKLLKAITTGSLRPNQRLVETKLAHELGMSRTPVREALKELLIKGYVSRLENGGLIVIDQSPSQIRNLFEVREALETAGITLACQRISEANLDRAQAYHLEYIEAVNKRLIDESIRINALFHDALISGCNNEQLLSILRTIRDHYLDRRVLMRFNSRHWQSIFRQHEKMLKAVRERNAPLARKTVHEHLVIFNRVALELL
jgi:DNA-binding GntR family transcriptional regulator